MKITSSAINAAHVFGLTREQAASEGKIVRTRKMKMVSVGRQANAPTSINRKARMSYDQRCYDLAKTFLEDAKINSDSITDDLAREIQRTIEDYLSEFDDKLRRQLNLQQ